MNNICEKAVLYVSGELPTDEKAAFETHLKTCASCRAEVALLNKTQEALNPPAAPGAVVENLFAKTTRKKALNLNDSRLFNWWTLTVSNR